MPKTNKGKVKTFRYCKTIGKKSRLNLKISKLNWTKESLKVQIKFGRKLMCDLFGVGPFWCRLAVLEQNDREP